MKTSFQCLFDSLINTQLSQVIIPFDASSEPKDIKNHVMSTIARVIAKVRLFYPSGKGKLMCFHGRQLCQNCFCLHSERGSTLKGKNLLLESKFFLFRVDPFSEGSCVLESK